MCILSTRKFGTSDAVAFSAALSDNTSLSELLASGHPLEVAGATALGEAMSRNSTLRSLCVGDNTFGDEVGSEGRGRGGGYFSKGGTGAGRGRVRRTMLGKCYCSA